MNWSWILTNSVSALVLPPLNLLLLCALGLCLRKKWPRLSLFISAGALLILALLSTRAGSQLLIRPLEQMTTPLRAPHNSGAQAIVVLAGGRVANAPEYDGRDVPTAITLVRMRYAATLHRETGLPLLVTGGAPQGAATSEAALMARSLQEDFSTPVKWVEADSDNTAQNAEFSARMLRAAGIQKILLVTDAMHMPRAQRIFTRYGLTVIAAPTQFLGRDKFAPLDLIPGGGSLGSSAYAMHEWVGLCWYRVRY